MPLRDKQMLPLFRARPLAKSRQCHSNNAARGIHVAHSNLEAETESALDN